MSEHTRGPWRATDGGIIDAPHTRGLEIADVYGADEYDGRGPDTAEAIANAARIVACVNACEGMDDPAAEVARLRETLAATERALSAAVDIGYKIGAERDEALEALESVMDDLDHYAATHGPGPDRRRDAVQAILRKAGRLK